MTRRRNVLLVVVDQWRGDTLGFLGHPVVKTPTVDALAAEGVAFARHYTVAVPCGPSRASLLTGLYAMNHRAVQNTVPLDARHTNLALEARRAGWDPALVGYTTTTPDPREWPAMDPAFTVIGDVMQGWRPVGAFEPDMADYFAWVAAHGHALPAHRPDIWLPDGPGDAGEHASSRPSRIPAALSDTAWFTERALAHLEGAGDRPWFLHLGYYRPHPPFQAPAPFHALYDPALSPKPIRAASPALEAAQHPLLAFYLEHTGRRSFFENGRGLARDMDEAEVARMRATYYGLISEVDAALGRIFDRLKETGQWDDTLIVFTCDHGEQLGDHHLLGKVAYFDQSFHVPLIVRDPDARADARRGTVVERFTESVDVMPTILDWIGAETPRACDGVSLTPFLHEGEPAVWRDHVHYEFDFRDIFYSKPERWLGVGMDEASLAVSQNETGKYVHFAALPPLFFDLETDPGQLHDRAADPAMRDRILAHAQELLSWRLRHAERTLTGHAASPEGLVVRR